MVWTDSRKGFRTAALTRAPLEFIGERTGRQDKFPVQWKDAGRAGAGVAHAEEFHRSEDGGERTGAKPAMGIEYLAVWRLEAQGEPHISVTAKLQVGLEEQALHLAAFGLLLGLDLVEGQLERAGGPQPGLKQSELEGRRCSAGGRGGCRCHTLTVLLP